MTTPPVASSSRLRLDALPPPPPPPPSTSRRRRAFRRNAQNIVAFVLVLSAPYLAAAAPLSFARALARGHDPHTALSRALADAAEDAASTTPPHSGQERIDENFVIGGLRLLQATVRHVVCRPRDWPQLTTFRRAVVVAMSAEEAQKMGEFYVLTPSMNPGFVVLSYLISFVGSLCTLELLIRRTSNKGIPNLFLLAFAGICFGAVSTFAMHFVGNQSLSLHFPSSIEAFKDWEPLYLTYQAGYTILSLVASCIGMTFAFFVMGTDIRFRQWRTWPCMPGRKDKNGSIPPGLTGDDYTRWKLQKNQLRKTPTVSTIFQQAGMATNWPIGEQRDVSGRGAWREWLFGPSAIDSPVMFDPPTGNDEDMLVKHDKELGEIDFRLGRAAVREEIDRRQTLIGTTPVDSAAASAIQSPSASVAGFNITGSDVPMSPLASYYTTGARTTPRPAPIRPPSPTEVFAPGYQFPPRTPVDNDSTSNLIPRSELGPNGSAMAWQDMSEATFPAIPRRASLPPTINAPPPPRIAQHTLSRIQSLAEHDLDSPTPHYSDKEDPNQFSSSDETTEDHINNSLPPEGLAYADYDDEMKTSVPGWRERLRLKIKSGAELTPWEKIERFFGLDVVTWGDVGKILLTGIIAGWGVAGMHYIGQVSIIGIPLISYDVNYVIGSVVIACGAVVIALYIMFIMLRPKLKHSWVSKIGVAIILAGAVCGMHYCAMVGTIYAWRLGVPHLPSNNTTKRAITGLVAALAFVACLGVTVFVMINSIRDRKQRARRRRVVVASVLLDNQGRMLVSAIDGLLPMCDIASLTTAETPKGRSRNRTGENGSNVDTTALGVDLTTGNDAFVQAMKMSWSWRNPFWSSMNPFASWTDLSGSSPQDLMFVHSPSAGDFGTTPNGPQRRASTMTAAESLSSAITSSRASVSRFLEKFAISATQLSVRLTGQTEGISRLGVLYDQILTTGWVRLNNGTDTVSKGQLIFLVRRVNSSQERSDLLSRHFIFADTTSVATSLHKTLSTPFDHVMPFLEDMRSFCDNTMRMTLRPNTLYAGVAIVQATPFDGLRILLNHNNRSQLPMREVCAFSTLPGLPVNVAEGLAGTLEEIGEAVTWLEGMNLLSVITRNMSSEATRVGGPRVGRLLAALERAVVPMLDDLLSGEDMAYILPRLQLHPVLVPLTPATPARKGQPGWAAPHLLVFYANYDVAVNTFGDKWLPFKLFRAQHECVMASKIGALTRATISDTASMPVLRPPSPTLSPGLSISSSIHDATANARYSYARRPSKVQFEVPTPEPTIAGYTFPQRSGTPSGMSAPGAAANFNSATGNGAGPVGGTGNGIPVPPNTNSVHSIGASSAGSPTTTTSFPTWSSRDRVAPRRSSLARSMFRDEPSEPVPQSPPGVASWDPNWLVNLLRTRLRATA